jgi:NADP-dependent 3-hydroxy acid dehydrogenase YdfG
VEADLAALGVRHTIVRPTLVFGPKDILVNNIGGVRRQKFLDQSERSWRRHIDLNMVSMLAATSAAAPLMIEAGRGGSIVNVASIEALRAAPGFAVYSASFFCCWRWAHRCRTSWPSSRNASMTRCSATAAFSTSPPAFSIRLSIISIFARSSGYARSLASKLWGPREDVSMAENRSGMGSSFAFN